MVALLTRLLGGLACVVLSALAWLLFLLPARLRLALGSGLGSFLRLIGFRQRVVIRNIDRLIHHFDGKDRAGLEAGFYRHLGSLILEILILFGPFAAYCKKNVRLSGLEHWKEAKKNAKGVLFLSSHVGNWELMAGGGALHGGIDILLVTKLLKPGWLHDAIERGRGSAGVLGTYEPRTFRDVLSHLRQNKTVGVVLDQYTGPPVGVRVPFFGNIVGTHSVLAILAKRTGAPVLPVLNHRDQDGTIHIEILPPIPWRPDGDPHREIAINTAAYSEQIEGFVKRYPEQWLWTHRRFKGDLGPLAPGEWEQPRARPK